MPAPAFPHTCREAVCPRGLDPSVVYMRGKRGNGGFILWTMHGDLLRQKWNLNDNRNLLLEQIETLLDPNDDCRRRSFLQALGSLKERKVVWKDWKLLPNLWPCSISEWFSHRILGTDQNQTDFFFSTNDQTEIISLSTFHVPIHRSLIASSSITELQYWQS